MCPRMPKWQTLKGSIRRFCATFRHKKKDGPAPNTATLSRKRISGRKDFKDHHEGVVPILKQPTGNRRTRPTQFRWTNQPKQTKQTSSSTSATDASTRDRQVKIRLSIAEEEMISPSPLGRRQERFQRPSLEQRQRLLAIAQDITQVMDTHSKERSSSEKSTTAKILGFLSRPSQRSSTKDPDEQVQSKLKAIEERIVQVEKEIAETSQQTSRFRPGKLKSKPPFKYAEEPSPAGNVKDVPPSPDLYPTMLESVREATAQETGSSKQPLKSYRAYEPKSIRDEVTNRDLPKQEAPSIFPQTSDSHRKSDATSLAYILQRKLASIVPTKNPLKFGPAVSKEGHTSTPKGELHRVDAGRFVKTSLPKQKSPLQKNKKTRSSKDRRVSRGSSPGETSPNRKVSRGRPERSPRRRRSSKGRSPSEAARRRRSSSRTSSSTSSDSDNDAEEVSSSPESTSDNS